MLCKNHSSAISRRVEPQGVEREHFEQRMIKMSRRSGDFFPFAFLFLLTKSIPHDLVYSLAISHHCITTEMTPGQLLPAVLRASAGTPGSKGVHHLLFSADTSAKRVSCSRFGIDPQ